MRALFPFSLVVVLTTSLACAVQAVPVPQPPQVTQPQWHSETIADDVEVEIARFPAEGDFLVLWIASSYGVRDPHLSFAAGLAAQGLEVWIADLIDAQFLARDRNAQLRTDPAVVADLVAAAHRRSGKPVVLMGSGGAAVPVLRGARAWQARAEPGSQLIGTVLLSPSLYRGVPTLGSEPEYLPIVTATRLPVAIFQPGLRSGGQRLGALSEALASAGSPVYAKLLPRVSALFARDALSTEARAAVNGLPARVRAVLPLLARADYPSQPAPLAQPLVTKRPGLDTSLKPFTDRPAAASIHLSDTDGRVWRVDDYRGRVTLVNFWASWCPPCVEEIPSLSRLQKAMAEAPFELISIDFGESPEVIDRFLERVEVDFPVLLDDDGKVAKDWRVIGLPATFVVGPDGRVRFGANGAIPWDAPEIVRLLRVLGSEPSG